MQTYIVPATETRTEITVINSRFITTAAPAFSVEQAKDFISRIRSEFSDASHNVPAFVIGHGSSTITHSSDDGEPSGTAGRPALAVLSGSGLGDIVLVVTRYFGGTKLGTGGLVRAYSDAVRVVLEVLPRAQKMKVHTIMVAIPYSWVERLRRLVENHHGQVIDESFGADVLVTARFSVKGYPGFRDALLAESHGSLTPEIIDSGPEIVPLGQFGETA